MDVTLSSSLNDVNWNEVAEVFNSVGWKRSDTARVGRSFQKSGIVRFAFTGDQLVGFGRAVTDGEYYATLYDVVVRPEWQGQGIGQQIVSALLRGLPGMVFIHLTATPGNEPFYQKLGFCRQKTAMTIMKNPDSEFARQLIE